MVVPDEIAERLAAEAANRGTSTEKIASEVIVLHVPAAATRRAALRRQRSQRSPRPLPEGAMDSCLLSDDCRDGAIETPSSLQL